MTRVLQFTAPNPPASVLVQLMVLMLNNASNIARLSGEAGYGTRPFQPSDFGEKHDDPNTYWIDYDATLPHLTDYGRTLMQSLLEGVSLDGAGNIVPAPSGKGMLQMAPMVAGTEIKLRLVDVEDLASGGYIAPANDADDPPAFVPEPDYDLDLSIRDTTPPFEHTGGRWVYITSTTQQFNARWTEVHANKPISNLAKTLSCVKPASLTTPCWVLWRPEYDEQEHSIWDPAHVTTVEPTWLNGAKSSAAWFQ